MEKKTYSKNQINFHLFGDLINGKDYNKKKIYLELKYYYKVSKLITLKKIKL